MSLTHVDVSVQTFYDILNSIIDKYTPCTKDNSHQYPIWFNSALKRCLEEKNKYLKRFKKFDNPRGYDTFDLLRARCKRLMDVCYTNFLESIEGSLHKNSKAF